MQTQTWVLGFAAWKAVEVSRSDAEKCRASVICIVDVGKRCCMFDRKIRIVYSST